ncbi:4'-phosphopantetheinyl transferase superfamily protein [uncultured Dokdonia sp.]|uniref:4'-phosphopantetheinyl transferase family protein n=1 Tax=uncultured Dokdonia sp. TaxID=575653 RepID=UPI00261DE1A2|nr:4'-phosphopantetheinyl transferase superfamily protein [uncultured Dokdonia sp.]
MWTAFSNKDLSLPSDQLHLWSVCKNMHEDRISTYWDILNATERERALKFRFQKDRSCFIIARGVLRMLLGNYLGIAPAHIEFQFGPNGKPYVIHSNDIKFNISHSGDTIILGFIKKHRIGVDVEYTKREVDVKKIAEHFFSEEEVRSLFALDQDYHTQAFYNCWTRKEAFIKAVGSGLAFPLDQFVVSLESTKEATLIDTKWDKEEKEKWMLHAIEPRKDYIGAVSVKGNVAGITSWSYQ